MVVLERPDRLLLLHQLDPSGPAAGYNPVHVFSPTHLRTPSPVPPSPCVDVLGVVVDVADVADVAAARMSGRSRRAPPPAGAPLNLNVEESIRDKLASHMCKTAEADLFFFFKAELTF